MTTERKLTAQEKLDCIFMLAEGYTYDGMSLKSDHQKASGINKNWHEYSSFLDYCEYRGLIKHTGISREGMDTYKIR